MPEIWVAGYPSFYGGADTELDHNIDLWRRHGIEVHLVPMFESDPKMRRKCNKRGCHTHKYTPSIFDNRIVVSFCNGTFLEKIPEIVEKGRPKKIVWFNCMTWTFEDEKVAHAHGCIDIFGFQTKFQREELTKVLSKYREEIVALEGYKPYFNDGINYKYRPPSEHFAMGRVSRDDPEKFADDIWKIFYKVCSPIKLKTFILGWSPAVEKKTGPPPPSLDWQTWKPNEIPISTFYPKLHCLVHKTGGSRENCPRIIPECWAYGVPFIGENAYGLPELIVDGETGFLCDSSDEMSHRASQLAFDEKLRHRLIEQGRDHLASTYADSQECIEPWLKLLK